MRLRILIVILVVILPSNLSLAQVEESRFSGVWSHVQLDVALPEFVRLTGADLIYDDSLIRSRVTHCVITRVREDELLRCIVQGAGLDFVRTSGGTYVIIKPAVRRSSDARIWGRVMDAATGRPLPFANIFLADARTGAASGQNGEFAIAGLLPGPHRLLVTYVGYDSAIIDSVDLKPGESLRIDVNLEPRFIHTETVIVDGLQQRLSSRLVEQVLVPGEIALSAHEASDVMRSATSLPGIASYRSLADLHLQGGATGEHVTRLDGMIIRDPVSFGRYLGAFSPIAIGEMTVHKTGFGADQGSHLAGVLALKHDLDTPGLAVHLDPVGVSGRAGGRIMQSSGGDLAAMVAARSSIWRYFQAPDMLDLLDDWSRVDPLLASAWKESSLDTDYRTRTFEPQVAFSDVHGAVRYKAGPHETLSASVFRATNRIGHGLVADPSDAGPGGMIVRDDYDWTNLAAQTKYQRLVGGATFASIQLSANQHDSGYSYEVGTVGMGQVPAYPHASDYDNSGSGERHRIHELAADIGATHAVTSRLGLDAGIGVRRTVAEVDATGPFIRPIMHRSGEWLLTGHAVSTVSAGVRTTLEAGTRITYVPARQTLYAEPRLSARRDGGGYAVRLAAGLYRQFVNQFELTSPAASSVIPSMLFWVPTGASLAPPRAIHLGADVLLLPTSHLTIQIETYHKHLSRLIALDYSVINARSAGLEPLYAKEFTEAGHGFSTGGGLRVNYVGNRFRSSIAYSFNRSRRAFPSRSDGRLETVPWEEPHRLSMDVRTGILPHIEVRGQWQVVYGRTWALRRAYYDYRPYLADDLKIDTASPGDHTLPTFQRLDLSVGYQRTVGRSHVAAHLSLLNALNNTNVFDQGIGTDGVTLVPRLLPGRRPAFSLTIRR